MTKCESVSEWLPKFQDKYHKIESFLLSPVPSCPKNEIFVPCLPPKECEPTCLKPNQPICYNKHCSAGCICKQPYIRCEKSQKCILREDCRVGEKFKLIFRVTFFGKFRKLIWMILILAPPCERKQRFLHYQPLCRKTCQNKHLNITCPEGFTSRCECKDGYLWDSITKMCSFECSSYKFNSWIKIIFLRPFFHFKSCFKNVIQIRNIWNGKKYFRFQKTASLRKF